MKLLLDPFGKGWVEGCNCSTSKTTVSLTGEEFVQVEHKFFFAFWAHGLISMYNSLSLNNPNMKPPNFFFILLLPAHANRHCQPQPLTLLATEYIITAIASPLLLVYTVVIDRITVGLSRHFMEPQVLRLNRLPFR